MKKEEQGQKLSEGTASQTIENLMKSHDKKFNRKTAIANYQKKIQKENEVDDYPRDLGPGECPYSDGSISDSPFWAGVRDRY